MRQDGSEEPDWDAIQTAYHTRELTVDALCRRHGIAASRLYRRIREDGWIRRTDLGLAALPQDGLAHAMLIRLRNVIARRIRSIEDRPAEAAMTETALEGERQARAIAALVRALDQVVALEQRMQTVSSEPGADDDAATAAWRAELAEALAALNNPQAVTGKDEHPAGGGEAPDGLGDDRPARPAPTHRERK